MLKKWTISVINYPARQDERLNSLPPPDSLSARRPVTLVLRLVLDERGRLEHGSLVGVSGVVEARFSGWKGLLRALRTWLKNQEPSNYP